MPTKSKSRKKDEDSKPVVAKETSEETNTNDVITRHGSIIHTS